MPDESPVGLQSDERDDDMRLDKLERIGISWESRIFAEVGTVFTPALAHLPCACELAANP